MFQTRPRKKVSRQELQKKREELHKEGAELRRGAMAWLTAKGLRIAKIFFPVFICGVLIGLSLGKHWSRNYDDPAEIAKYVAASAKPLNGQSEKSMKTSYQTSVNYWCASRKNQR